MIVLLTGTLQQMALSKLSPIGTASEESDNDMKVQGNDKVTVNVSQAPILNQILETLQGLVQGQSALSSQQEALQSTQSTQASHFSRFNEFAYQDDSIGEWLYCC